MANGLTRVALWALVFIVLASTLATIPGAQAGSQPNTLLGYVKQAGGSLAPPVPAGVTVDLVDSATHATYSTSTSTSSGEFNFTDATTGNSLVPGLVRPVGTAAGGHQPLRVRPVRGAPLRPEPPVRLGEPDLAHVHELPRDDHGRPAGPPERHDLGQRDRPRTGSPSAAPRSSCWPPTSTTS